MSIVKRKSSQSIDIYVLAVVLLLSIFGLIALTSAGSAIGFQKFGDSYYFVKRQLMSFILGIAAMIILINIDYRQLKKYAVYFLLGSILLLILVFVPGIGSTLLGGSRWINIAGLPFQPSELAKLTFIIYLATWLESRNTKKRQSEKNQLWQFFILLGIVALLITLQPDLGTFFVIAFVSIVMYFLAGAPIKHMAYIAMSGIGFIYLMIRIAPYRFQRFIVFLDPSSDPRGVGYHIQQSLIAIGSGGLFGVGLGKSLQKFTYLPEAAGDSIFAVIAEEMGFIVIAIIISLFLFLFIRGIRIANAAPDEFGKLLVSGIMVWLTLQAFLNMAALTSLMPLTGIPLPFISYGGSALAISLASIGIVLNVTKQTK